MSAHVPSTLVQIPQLRPVHYHRSWTWTEQGITSIAEQHCSECHHVVYPHAVFGCHEIKIENTSCRARTETHRAGHEQEARVLP